MKRRIDGLIVATVQRYDVHPNKVVYADLWKCFPIFRSLYCVACGFSWRFAWGWHAWIPDAMGSHIHVCKDCAPTYQDAAKMIQDRAWRPKKPNAIPMPIPRPITGGQTMNPKQCPTCKRPMNLAFYRDTETGLVVRPVCIPDCDQMQRMVKEKKQLESRVASLEKAVIALEAGI